MKSYRSGDSANPSSDNPNAFGGHVLIAKRRFKIFLSRQYAAPGAV